jgi:hypothetical protein
VEGLLLETVTRDGNCLFRKFRPYVVFEIVQNDVGCVLIQGKTTKFAWVSMEYMVLMKENSSYW